MQYPQRGMYVVLTVYPAHRLTAQQLHQQPLLFEHVYQLQGYVRNTMHKHLFDSRRLIPNEFQHLQAETLQLLSQFLQ
ncbi:hypothetical protein D3C78_1689520 [compost metagenome]